MSKTGVKQGACIFPNFICYLELFDELFDRLNNSGYRIGSTFADDVTLIAPSLHSSRQMIKICEQLQLHKHDLKETWHVINLL